MLTSLGSVNNQTNIFSQKVNQTAIVDPAVTNDNTQGYDFNSLWLNTVTGNWFVAVGVTTGTAIWKKITVVSESGVIVVEGGITYGESETINITVNTNDLTPPNFDSTSLIRLNVTVGSDVTGLIAPTPIPPSIVSPAKEVYMFNVGTANCTLKNNSASSLAANRFLFGTDILLQSGEGLVLLYDNVSLRYRSAAKNI